MRLYHNPISTCSQKVRMVLHEKGLAFDDTVLDLQQGEQFEPDYQALNPNAVVPTLEDQGSVMIESTLINEYLDDAYPNPFNPEATIRFSLPQDQQVVLQVFNLQGQLVKTLHQGYVAAGVYESVWDGTDETGASAANGVYLYSLQAGTFSQTKKMTLLK